MINGCGIKSTYNCVFSVLLVLHQLFYLHSHLGVTLLRFHASSSQVFWENGSHSVVPSKCELLDEISPKIK